jgi:hypothetical protein
MGWMALAFGSLAALMTRDLVGRTKAAFLAEKVFRPVVALVDIATAIFVG